MDMSLFHFSKGQITVFLLVYVDDIIIASSSPDATTALLHALQADFALKDLGPLHYFLGLEVTRAADGLYLSQQKYTADLLQRAGMTTCKPAPTPLSSSSKFSAHDGVILSPKDATKYRSIRWCLAVFNIDASRHFVLHQQSLPIPLCPYIDSLDSGKTNTSFSQAYHLFGISHSAIILYYD
jgi:hypothetical protein